MPKSADSPEGFEKYAAELEALVMEQGWDLKKFRRKTWYAFKPSEFGQAAFGVGFRLDGTLYLYIKRIQDRTSTLLVKMSAWNETDNQAEYDLDNGIRLKSFLPLLQVAYQRC